MREQTNLIIASYFEKELSKLLDKYFPLRFQTVHELRNEIMQLVRKKVTEKELN